MQENYFMKEAIFLAQKGKWHTAPNPCVGAVLVYKDTMIASGYHTEYGKAHAEVECILEAIKFGVHKNEQFEFSNKLLANAYEKNVENRKNKQIYFSDCTLYVTLEPCSHEGKTPPCTSAIIESGIKKVVVGVRDINPKAKGGIEILEEHNIDVEVGVCVKECEELLADFTIWQNKNRPYVILKMACSLDGKIGHNTGGNHKISGEESKEVLMKLRENIGIGKGSILVGAKTFLKDNPKLTARTRTAIKNPRAIILGSKYLFANFEEQEYYCFEQRADETILYFSNEQRNAKFLNYLESKNIKTVEIAGSENKINLKLMLEDLYKNQACPYVLCEGGPTLGLNLLEQNLVDLLILYVAPTIMGDSNMQDVFTGRSISEVSQALNFKIVYTKSVGQDLHIYLKPEN